MRTKLPCILLLAGLLLLIYPGLCQHITTAQQQWAMRTDETVTGILEIPRLQLRLPIRCGTSEDTLRKGIGLLEGTHLEGHAVLCGHRGLPEAVLFRDLDQLIPGDLFFITTGEEILPYQVDQILVVDPADTVPLLPEAGKELCTLLTCTPYGINSHRLLVRGLRLPGVSS